MIRYLQLCNKWLINISSENVSNSTVGRSKQTIWRCHVDFSLFYVSLYTKRLVGNVIHSLITYLICTRWCKPRLLIIIGRFSKHLSVQQGRGFVKAGPPNADVSSVFGSSWCYFSNIDDDGHGSHIAAARLVHGVVQRLLHRHTRLSSDSEPEKHKLCSRKLKHMRWIQRPYL